ncbi:hypothetical protein [Neorhizobium sp. DAR64860/K0K1]|uniref:hypothetical protein n=1 Tax=Neorhizobium sp. DAR64860/K0K1 TaxID=3421955 RepID=UPI003D2A53D2
MPSIASPAIYRFRRAELERWIEEAIETLNAIDGDPDLEDDELEAVEERENERATWPRAFA